MKRLLLLGCLLLLGPGPANAADPIHGDWFILTGKNKISSSAPDHKVVKDIAGLVKDNVELRFLVLPADSSYVLQAVNAYWGSNAPDSLWKKDVEINAANRGVKSIALMAQGGWALLYDKCELAQDGVPAAIGAQLQTAANDVKRAGGTLRSLAFAPDGGWVLLFDKDFKEHGLPNDLRQTLADHQQKAIGVRCVAFDSQSDWFLLDDRNECFSNNPSHPASKKLAELRSQGETLQWITFTPGVYKQGYTLEHHPVKRIRAVLTLKLDSPEGGITDWTVLPAQAPELPRQRDIKITLEPAGQRVREKGPLKQDLLLSRVSDKPQGFQAKVTYEMTLYTNRLMPLLAGQTPPDRKLPPTLVKAYTIVTDDVTAQVFQDFLNQAKLRRGTSESDMAFARRTFLYIAKHFQFAWPPPPGDTVQSRKGDCGGLAWVFVRTMRANGVPARLLVGRWVNAAAPAKDGKPPEAGYHVKAEFFAQGIGWVGADLNGAVITGDLCCFGNEGGDFVVFDLDLARLVAIFPGDPPSAIGGTQSISWWSRGPAVKPPQAEEHCTVDALDQQPARTPFRSGWKRPVPSGPHALPPPRSAPRHQAIGQPKTAAAGTPVQSREKDTSGDTAFPWLLLAPIVAVPVLLLGWLFSKRRRTSSTNDPPTVPSRCRHCGLGMQTAASQVGQWFQCPGCGTLQTIQA